MTVNCLLNAFKFFSDSANEGWVDSLGWVDKLEIIPRHNCKKSVDQQRGKGSKTAVLRTTNCAILFPRLPPFSGFINDIQNFALGE